jgi:hypothetical protein
VEKGGAMGINIKHAEVERDIRELARTRGTSLTDAIGLAVRAELERDAAARRTAEFDAIIRKAQALAREAEIIDPRPYREIIYDEDGLPK